MIQNEGSTNIPTYNSLIFELEKNGIFRPKFTPLKKHKKSIEVIESNAKLIQDYISGSPELKSLLESRRLGLSNDPKNREIVHNLTSYYTRKKRKENKTSRFITLLKQGDTYEVDLDGLLRGLSSVFTRKFSSSTCYSDPSLTPDIQPTSLER